MKIKRMPIKDPYNVNWSVVIYLFILTSLGSLANYCYHVLNGDNSEIETNIIEAIKDGHVKTDALRNDVDNGPVELRIQVETIERDSTATSDIANKALRLARTSQQDYYNLTNAINYNKARLEGWQEYYCYCI